jgi:hypothetical protein
MPALPTSLLRTIGTLIQKTFQTITVKEMIDDTVDIVCKRNRVYRGLKLTSTIIVGGGCATLFLLDGNVGNYFVPIVENTLPFLGPYSQIVIGSVGFWLGGAFGSCLTKAIAKEITFQKEGFRNPRLLFKDEEVKNIILGNPEFFRANPDPKLEDMSKVREMLEKARERIEECRKNGELEDKRKYKKAFFEVIYRKNLLPLMQQTAATLAAAKASERVHLRYVTIERGHDFPPEIQLDDPMATPLRYPREIANDRRGYHQRQSSFPKSHSDDLPEVLEIVPLNALDESSESKRKPEDRAFTRSPVTPYRGHFAAIYNPTLSDAERKRLEEERQKATLQAYRNSIAKQARVIKSMPPSLLEVLPSDISEIEGGLNPTTTAPEINTRLKPTT